MLTGDDAFGTLGQHLVDAVLAQFAAKGIEPPDRAGVVPAPIVADDCQCGLLAVAVARITPSQDGKVEGLAAEVQPPTAAQPWMPFLLGELQVAVLRCATTEATPSARTLSAEATGVHADAYWTMVAVVCELNRLRQAGEIEDYSVRDQPFLPAQGGCQGPQLNVGVSVDFRCPCP
jgi:hypothetical protein